MAAGADAVAHPPRPPIPIAPLDEGAMAAARDRVARSGARRSSGASATSRSGWPASPAHARPRARARLVVVAADHGGAADASAGAALRAVAAGHGLVPVLAAEVGADVVLVDAGVRERHGRRRAACAPASRRRATPPRARRCPSGRWPPGSTAAATWPPPRRPTA